MASPPLSVTDPQVIAAIQQHAAANGHALDPVALKRYLAAGAHAEGGSKAPHLHPAACGAVIVDAKAGEIAFDEPREKLAIVGFSQSTMGKAPFGDPAWVIAGLNQLGRYLPRADFWFELHQREVFVGDVVRGTDYVQWLKDAPFPIFMEADDYDAGRLVDFPQAVRFPIEACTRLVGKIYRPDGTEVPLDYYESTIALEIAWGCLMGFKEIGIWGVDLIVGEEYCVAPETKVLTGDLRWIRADKVSIGDRVVAFDEHSPGEAPNGRAHSRMWREATVEGAARLKRPCYRIRLSDGASLVSSAEHRWLTQVGDAYRWRQTQDLVTPSHRRPTRLVRLLDVWDEDRSWEAGYLAAAFDGEGSLTNSGVDRNCANHIQFAQKRNGMSQQVEAALAALEFKTTQTGDRRGDECVSFGVGGGRPEILRFLGQVRPRRLLPKFSADRLGRLHAKDTPHVIGLEPLGEQEVIGLHTSTGTFVADGFASHNSYQKPNTEFWLGFCQARGIKLTIPEESALLKPSPRRYGHAIPDAGPFSVKFFEAAIQSAENTREEWITKLNHIDGGLATLRNLREAQMIYDRGGRVKDIEAVKGMK